VVLVALEGSELLSEERIGVIVAILFIQGIWKEKGSFRWVLEG